MFRGLSFIVSTMQEETTPIFKRLWYDWTQQQPGIEPTNPLGQCWVPPIVTFYDQQGLLRTYSLPGGSIRIPHPGSPRGVFVFFNKSSTVFNVIHIMNDMSTSMYSYAFDIKTIDLCRFCFFLPVGDPLVPWWSYSRTTPCRL